MTKEDEIVQFWCVKDTTEKKKFLWISYNVPTKHYTHIAFNKKHIFVDGGINCKFTPKNVFDILQKYGAFHMGRIIK